MQRQQLHSIIDASDFSGSTVVITGSGSGIGRATAKLMASLKAQIILAELTNNGAEVEAEIRNTGGQAVFIQTDVSSPESVTDLAQKTHKLFSSVDILINNAIYSPCTSVLDMDVGTWDRVMAVNLRGTFLTCKAFLPTMLKNNQGKMINMISTEALPYMSAYMASKQGIAAFSRSLAGEVGEKGIKVVAFAPGFVDTPGLRKAAQELSPHTGLTTEEFMNLSFYPAYNHAMPVEDAALATALLAARYMGTYHGEEVNGYAILEHAGVIKPSNQEHVQTAQHHYTQKSLEINSTKLLEEANGLVKYLAVMLTETAAEFEQLPLLVRPLARQGFKSKAGKSLPEWEESTHNLIEILASRSSSEIPDQYPKIDFEEFSNDLNGLMRYYREVPQETARFTREVEVLQEIEEISARRVNTLQRLKDLLCVLIEQDLLISKPFDKIK